MSTRIVAGTVITDGSGNLQLTIGGVQQTAFWASGVNVNPGDSVICGIYEPAEGAPFIYVLGLTLAGPNLPGITGTVATVVGGSSTITVTIGGVSTVCRFLSTYTPTVGDLVSVLWQGSTPLVLSKIGTVPAPAPAPTPPPAPPPAPVASGNSKFPATNSGTFQGIWDSYYGQNVYTGSGWAPTDTGSWFYSGATKQLSGRTITGFAFYLSSRRPAGDYNQVAPLNFYRTTDNYQGSGDTNRVEGPYTINVAPNFPGGWIELPTDWGQQLATIGGGISIAGEPYVGITGVGLDAQSGQTSFNWTRS